MEFNLPVIFECAIKFGEAIDPRHFSKLEGGPFGSSGQAFFRALNPQAIPFANPPCDPAIRVAVEEAANDQPSNMQRGSWHRCLVLAHVCPDIRRAILTLALAYCDLRSNDPDIVRRGRELLDHGTRNLWDGMGAADRDAVRPLLAATHRAWGWPDPADSEPGRFDGRCAVIDEDRFVRGWRTLGPRGLNEAGLGQGHPPFVANLRRLRQHTDEALLYRSQLIGWRRWLASAREEWKVVPQQAPPGTNRLDQLFVTIIGLAAETQTPLPDAHPVSAWMRSPDGLPTEDEDCRWLEDWGGVLAGLDVRLRAADTGPLPIPPDAPRRTPSPVKEAFEAVARCLLHVCKIRRNPPTVLPQFRREAASLSDLLREAREAFAEATIELQAVLEAGGCCAFGEALGHCTEVGRAVDHVSSGTVPFWRASAHVVGSAVAIDYPPLIERLYRQTITAAERILRHATSTSTPPAPLLLSPTSRLSGAGTTDRPKRVPKEEANVLVREWLAEQAKENPSGITRDGIADAIGVSRGAVSKTPAWKAFSQKRDAETRSGSRELPLTDAMLAVIPANCDVSDELAELVEDQRKEEAEESRRHKRRHGPS